MSHTTLYRLFGQQDELLYVGIASNPGRRFEQHAKDKPWWSDVERVTLEHRKDRKEALAAESAAIAAEQPRYNIAGNAGRGVASPSALRRARLDRLSNVEEQGFQADSLVGSFFLSDAERGLQGCIVGEPSVGLYLVELFSWLMGESLHQQLVRIEDMTEWRFYDDNEWMKFAYEYGGVKEQWERQRESA